MQATTAATLALAGAILIAVTGCVQEVPPAPEPSSAATETQDRDDALKKTDWPRPISASSELWFVTSENAVGKFTLIGEPYAEAEELREHVGADPVAYTTVTVDNRNGNTGVDMHELAAYDADGRKYSFHVVEQFMDKWGQKSREDDVRSRNPLATARSEHEVFANVGEVEEFVMATEDTDMPDEFVRVSVKAHGNVKEVQAYPPAESEYVNLDFEAPLGAVANKMRPPLAASPSRHSRCMPRGTPELSNGAPDISGSCTNAGLDPPSRNS
jgi:hypothetical protein